MTGQHLLVWLIVGLVFSALPTSANLLKYTRSTFEVMTGVVTMVLAVLVLAIAVCVIQ
jgi:hypothetical protein